MSKKMDLAAALAELGLSGQNLISQEVVEKQTEFESLKDSRTLESESVIFYIETKGDADIWKRRICALCGSKFLSTYTGVNLCTDECRKDYFLSKGMKWNPTGKTEAERWGGTIPKIIGPEATKALQEISFTDESILTNKEDRPVGPDENFNVDDFLNSLED